MGGFSNEPLFAARFSSDGSLLAVAAGARITLWQPYTNSLLLVLPPFAHPFREIAANSSSCSSAVAPPHSPVLALEFLPSSPFLLALVAPPLTSKHLLSLTSPSPSPLSSLPSSLVLYDLHSLSTLWSLSDLHVVSLAVKPTPAMPHPSPSKTMPSASGTSSLPASAPPPPATATAGDAATDTAATAAVVPLFAVLVALAVPPTLDGGVQHKQRHAEGAGAGGRARDASGSSSASSGSRRGVLLVFGARRPVPVAAWLISDVQGASVAFLEPSSPSSGNKGEPDVPSDWSVVVVSGKREVMVLGSREEEERGGGKEMQGVRKPAREEESEQKNGEW